MSFNGWQQFPRLRSWKIPGKKLIDTPLPWRYKLWGGGTGSFSAPSKFLVKLMGFHLDFQTAGFGRSFSCQMRSKSLVVFS